VGTEQRRVNSGLDALHCVWGGDGGPCRLRSDGRTKARGVLNQGAEVEAQCQGLMLDHLTFLG
jgi:hypothetical protein